MAGQRDDKLGHFHRGLYYGWGRREAAALAEPPPPRPAFRLVVVRHGMGHHNDMGGALSLFNRDATLNDVGQQQCRAVHETLTATGALRSLDLVVVSPFTRALETAATVLGESAGRPLTFVHPLAAEHTLLRSAMQQGDRGSTAEELRRRFPAADFPQYDFTPVEEYCAATGITNGKWWHHDADEDHESPAAFALRAAAFRRWLARLAAERNFQNVMVVSHGGLLVEAFGSPAYDNVEFRTFSMLPIDGSFTRVVPAAVERLEMLSSVVRRE